MRNEERALERQRLDVEQRHFQRAERHRVHAPEWLKRVRRALGVHAVDMAAQLGVNPSVIFRLEESEARKTISLRALEKLARTMDCTLVYAVVPLEGKTLVELAEIQAWGKKLKG